MNRKNILSILKQLKYPTVFVILLLIIIAFDNRLCVKPYEIETDKLTGSVRIALITDLHSCEYGSDQAELIQAVEIQQPDIVLLGGDICDDVISDENTELLLKGISGSYPCYYVTGNHEYWSGRLDSILELFRSYNVTILNGSCDIVEIRDQKITVCGITDPDAVLYTNDGMDTKSQLDLLSEAADTGNYTILLAHRPELIDLYSQYDFDLILSGHAHGGQWRLPGILNGLLAPDQGWFPEYAGGIYENPGMAMIVSRGLARESTPVPRIFNRPEVVIVTLTPSDNT